MTKQIFFTSQRERHQEFSITVSEYMLTCGPVAQANAAWQFQWDGVSVPEDWIDQQGYVIDAPTMIHAGSVKNNGNFRDVAYLVR